MNLGGLDFGKVLDSARKGLDKARQYAEGLNELEIKVEEATNSDKWGPHGTLMQEITKRSYNLEEYKQILGILARRLHSEPRNWRQIYKALLLLEYMAKNGPQRLVTELKSNGRVFNRLQNFEYIDDEGKDQGLNIRNRAKELWNLVHDDELIESEREKASMNRKKYGGHDASSSLFQSIPKQKRIGESKSQNPFGSEAQESGASSVDPIEATAERVSQLEVDEAAGGSVQGGRTPSAPVVKHKPKLSQLSADTSIAGSIAAMASKFPAQPTKSTPPAPSAAEPNVNGSLNLLDFGDEDTQEAAQSGGNVSAPNAPGPEPTGDDWADFTGAPSSPIVKSAADSSGSKPQAVPIAPFAPDGGDEWESFASAPAVSSSPEKEQTSVSGADPFAVPKPVTVSASMTSPQPSTMSSAAGGGIRAALPADAFSVPAVEPIPVPDKSEVHYSSPTVSNAGNTSKSPEKDPFADLLG